MGDKPSWSSYECHECNESDVPALVAFYGGGVDKLVCHDCLKKALDLFFDPTLILTKTPMSPVEKIVRDFATKAHGDQKYDSGTAPYVLHLAAVRDAVIEFGFGPSDDSFGENYVAAAWLHDVLEDTAVVPGTIEGRFGAVTFDLVWAVTGEGESRKQRNEDAYQKMERNVIAIPLKLADRIVNMRTSKISSPDKLFPMYISEYPAFRTRLREPCLRQIPKAARMWAELDEIRAQQLRDEETKKTEPE